MSVKLSYDEIEKAFMPQKEITDPKQFIGRYKEIEIGTKSLREPNSFLVIYGLRGIGKSSLANQIKLIAQGNNYLPLLCNCANFIPKKGFNYIVHHVKCDEFVDNIPKLIKRILYGDDTSESILKHQKNSGRKFDHIEQYFANKRSISASEADESKYERVLSEELVHLFKQAVNVIQKDNQENSGVLILIDEFDMIKDKTGFASIVKTCTSDYVKFAIVGIADDISDLLEDHASVSRQVDYIELPLMPESDLIKIITTAETNLKNKIKFSVESTSKIVTLSKGYPYFVHLLGKEILNYAFEEKINTIEIDDCNVIVDRLINGRLKISFDDIYYAILRTSKEREVILKIIANDNKSHSLIEDVYFEARLAGIEKPSQYIDELFNPKVGKPVIQKVRQDRYCRFKDPIFKLYVSLRKSLH